MQIGFGRLGPMVGFRSMLLEGVVKEVAEAA